MSTVRRKLLRFRDNESGTSLIEAALVLPILIPLMLGVYDFAQAFSTLATANKSIQAAARYLAILPKTTICSWGLTRAQKLAVYGNIGGTGPKVIPDWNVGDITLDAPTTTTCNDATVSTIPIVEISADVPFKPIIFSAFGTSWTFSVSRQERWIGQ